MTIGGGAIFGAVGLILAAPLTSAIVRIGSDVREARGADAPLGPAVPAVSDPPTATEGLHVFFR